jgi:ankyrin repeat protein
MRMTWMMIAGVAAVCLCGFSFKDWWLRPPPDKYFKDKLTQDLVRAAAFGDEKGVQEAIKEGASPNAVGTDGSITPLLYVLSTTRSHAGLKALLKSGADSNRASKNGSCPMVLAARSNDSVYLKIFLEGGGDPNLWDGSHSTLLQVAALNQRWDNLQVLLDHGADINKPDGGGYTLVMNMAIDRKYDRVVSLIERGADIKAQAKNKDTLASIVAEAKVRDDSPQAPWRQKVIELLKRRGVELPK